MWHTDGWFNRGARVTGFSCAADLNSVTTFFVPVDGLYPTTATSMYSVHPARSFGNRSLPTSLASPEKASPVKRKGETVIRIDEEPKAPKTSEQLFQRVGIGLSPHIITAERQRKAERRRLQLLRKKLLRTPKIIKMPTSPAVLPTALIGVPRVHTPGSAHVLPPLPMTDDDDVPCAICGDRNTPDINPILLCDGKVGHCPCAAHMRCAGLEAKPDGDWFCADCACAPAEAAALHTVERLIGKREARGKVFYKVRWAGSSEDKDTWEPATNITPAAISEYESDESSDDGAARPKLPSLSLDYGSSEEE